MLAITSISYVDRATGQILVHQDKVPSVSLLWDNLFHKTLETLLCVDEEFLDHNAFQVSFEVTGSHFQNQRHVVYDSDAP